MAANDQQVGGDHYRKEGDLQHWDMVVKFDLDYFQGQITKYVMRWRDKGGIQDLEKARHFLDKYIEVATKQEMDRNRLLRQEYTPTGLRTEIGAGKGVSGRQVPAPRKK